MALSLDLFNEMTEAVNDRSVWETKMSSYYTLRFDGVRRTAKPYKNAPDVHYPLVDTVIDKLKPFYAQQFYGDLVVSTFVAIDPVPKDLVSSVENWFDYKMKQCSNFEREILNGIDMMLHYGTCPVKIYWDEVNDELAFEAVDPIYILVPKNALANKPEWLVHIKPMSRAAYEAEKTYKQDKDFVDSITGGSSYISGVLGQKEQAQQQREGLTYAKDKNQIVIWECYTKNNKGKWQIDTIAPVKGEDEGQVRETFGLPYRHGELPFVQLRNEATTKGWYAPRGIAEILIAHELSLCKSWNSKLQFLDFFGHPVYTNDGLAPINSQDFQAAPGRILPQGVAPAIPPSAPIQFDEEMQFVRALAEDRIQIPDLGSGQHLSARPGAKGEITATQVNAVIGLSNQSNDLRSRLFRMQLADIYNQAWGLLSDPANIGSDTQFISNGSVVQLPKELLSKKYSIHPSGSADSWNKAYKIQDATMTYQMLVGKPNVNQDELLKYMLEAKEPHLSQRLFLDSGFGSMLEGEKQASELLLMEAGYPASVKPNDKDAIHLTNMGQWLQKKVGNNEPISPQTAGLVFNHAQGHAQQAAQKQDKEAMQIVKQSGPAMQLLQSIMAQGGQMQPQAGGPAGAPAGQAPQGQNGQKESISINYKDAPDSIKRQMEQAAGFQPAVGQPSQDDKKLAVDAMTKTHATAAGAAKAMQPKPAPAPRPAPVGQ